MARTYSILLIALFCGAACGGGSAGKQPGAQPIGNTAPPGAAAPASDAGSAKKCYADPDNNDDEHHCEGIGTCLALCKSTFEECVARCRVQTCPEVPCPPGE